MPEEFITCNDCGKTIEQGEKMTEYDLGDRGKFYKCDKCFEDSDVLEGFQECLVFSRIVGYFSAKSQWNLGKQSEDCDRKEYKI